MEKQIDETKAYMKWLREHSGYQKKHGIPHREPVVPKPVKINKKKLEEQELEKFKNEHANTVSQIRYERTEEDIKMLEQYQISELYKQAKLCIKRFNKLQPEFKVMMCIRGKVPIMKDFIYKGTNFNLRNYVPYSRDALKFQEYVCCPIMDTIVEYSVADTYIRKGNSMIYIQYIADHNSHEDGAFFIFKIYKTAKLMICDLIKRDDGSYHYVMGIRSADEPFILEHLKLNRQKSIYERISIDEHTAVDSKSAISPSAK